MKKDKKTRIIENIFDIICNTDFRKEAKKQLKRDTKQSNISLDYDKKCIYIENAEGNKILYKITIEKM